MKHWRLGCRNGAAFELGREWPVCGPASTGPPRRRYTRAHATALLLLVPVLRAADRRHRHRPGNAGRGKGASLRPSS